MEDAEITRLAAVIDHTRLAPATGAADIRRLCREAAAHRFATVCVNPVWVDTAVSRLEETGVAVCTVIGFPLGATPTDVKRYETLRAISDGAREVDMVINIGWLKGGDFTATGRDMAEVTRAARDGGALTKVIIEAALLTDDEKVAACELARDAGADFVKTSTGFGPGGATVADVVLMRHAVGGALGVKAAGGIRDIAAVQALLTAGATRIGTSAGVEILRSARDA